MEFKDLNKEERLKIVYNSYIDNEATLQKSLGEGKTNERFFSMTKWNEHLISAIYNIFITEDISCAKQHFYSCGRLDEFLINKYNEKILDYGIDHIGCALLSDNTALIKRYAQLTTMDFEKSVRDGNAAVFIIQCLIKDDLENLAKAISIMKSKTAKNDNILLDIAFYEAFAKRDKSKCEEIIEEFLTPKLHKQRNKYKDLINEFISFPALTYAKLCFYKGVEVNINNKFIPLDLLRIRSNEHYKEEYSFLK